MYAPQVEAATPSRSLYPLAARFANRRSVSFKFNIENVDPHLSLHPRSTDAPKKPVTAVREIFESLRSARRGARGGAGKQERVGAGSNHVPHLLSAEAAAVVRVQGDDVVELKDVTNAETHRDAGKQGGRGRAQQDLHQRRLSMPSISTPAAPPPRRSSSQKSSKTITESGSSVRRFSPSEISRSRSSMFSNSTAPSAPILQRAAMHVDSNSAIIRTSPRSDRSSRLLSTEGLPYMRHRLKKGGFIEILRSDHDDYSDGVLLDLKERTVDCDEIGAVVMNVSRNGSVITVQHSNNHHPGRLLRETYVREALPVELERMYSICSKFVMRVRSRTIRISFYRSYRLNPRVKIDVFSDPAPATYEVEFKSFPSSTTSLAYSSRQNITTSFSAAVRIRIDRRSDTIQIAEIESTSTPSSYRSYQLSTFSNGCDTIALDIEVIEMVEWTLRQASLADLLIEQLDLPSTNDVPAMPSMSSTLRAISLAIATPEKIGSMEHRSAPAESSESIERIASVLEEDRRCLPGAGWIIRLRDPTDGRTVIGIKVLYPDGVEVSIDAIKSQVEMNGKSYVIDDELPMRVKARLGLVGDMMTLFD